MPQRRTTRTFAPLGIAASLLVLTATATAAHPDHEGDVGKGVQDSRVAGLPATQAGVELIGKLGLSGVEPGRVSDVDVHNGYAYLGHFAMPECAGSGAWIVDVSDPARPREVRFLSTGDGNFTGEGVQAMTFDTPQFSGDVLALSNEVCGEVGPNTRGGVTLVDVSAPERATPILSHFGELDAAPPEAPQLATDTHSVKLWEAGGRVYAVLTDDVATADVFDVSDPRNPMRVAEYDLPAMFPQILQPPESLGPELSLQFFHDFTVREIDGRQVVLVSHWDAGQVMLDITDPATPVLLGDSDYPAVDPELREQTGLERAPEGNGHQAEFTRDNRFIVATNEDFTPQPTTVTVGDARESVFLLSERVVDPPLEGDGVFVGDACVLAPPGVDGAVAVAETGACPLQQKIDTIEAAGGYGAIVLTLCSGCELTAPDVTVERSDVPVVYVSRELARSAFGLPDDATPIVPGTRGGLVQLDSCFDGWGYVHLYDARPGADGKLVERDTYAVPEAMDPAFVTGFGALSVHEVATSEARDELAYLSYYGAGFRVIDVSGGEIREVGRFLDREGPDGNDFWGVEVFEHEGQELVAASDRNFGLYLFRYTG